MASYGGIVLRYCHDVKGVIAKLVVGCNIHDRTKDGLATADGIKHTIAQWRKRRDNLLLAIEEGTVAQADVRDRLLEIREKITAMEADLAQAEAQATVRPYSAEHIRAMVIRLLETEKAPGERRAMLHVLLGRVTLLDGQPELTLNLLR